ncbi:hypothetical protein MUP37_03005 [Candidatus Bathyarchaeota archaeon]|nr:hypothetical protein [Candidatus Bathyarchaeota archaeon]
MTSIAYWLSALGTLALAVATFISLKEVRRIQKENVRPRLILNMFRCEQPPHDYVIFMENLGKWYAYSIRANLSFVDANGKIRERALEISRNIRLVIDGVGKAYVRFIPQGAILSYRKFCLKVEYAGISEPNLSDELTINLNDLKTISEQTEIELFIGRPKEELGMTIIDLQK